MLVSFAFYLAQLAFKWLLITRLIKHDSRFPLVLFAVAKSYVSLKDGKQGTSRKLGTQRQLVPHIQYYTVMRCLGRRTK
jgi:hypothetical protein